MAKIVEVELVAKTDKAVDGVNKVEKAVEKTARSAKKASKELSGMQQVGNEAVKGLDRLTGGLASKFVAVGSAAKLSGKAMKTALISSGIGLAVVAVGLLVENWDAISEALGFVNKDLETQADQLNKNIALNDEQLKSLDNQEQILILQGKSTVRIKEEKKKILLIQQEENRLLLENYKTQLLKEQKQQLELSFYDKLKIAVASASGIAGQGAIARAKSFEKSAEQIAKLAEIQTLVTDAKTRDEQLTIKLLQIEKKAADEKIKSSENAAKLAEDAEKARIDAIERIRKGLIDTEAEERAEKLRLIKEDYDQQIQLAAEFYGKNSFKILELKAAQKKAEDTQQDEFDLKDKEKRLAKEEENQEKLIGKLELNKEFDNLNFEEQRNLLNKRDEQLLNDTTLTEEQRTALTKQFAEARTNLAVSEQDAKLATLDAVGGGLQDLSSIAGEETAAGKALALAAATINTYAGIAGIWGAQPEGTATTTLIAKIAASTAVASAGFAAVKKIASTKVPATSGGGGGGGATSYSPPSIPAAFNIVGASGETQLADAIGSQTQRPARAYVVSNDVTTAQEMDRNIIEGASI